MPTTLPPHAIPLATGRGECAAAVFFGEYSVLGFKRADAFHP